MTRYQELGPYSDLVEQLRPNLGGLQQDYFAEPGVLRQQLQACLRVDLAPPANLDVEVEREW
jgi:hypothetical protein